MRFNKAQVNKKVQDAVQAAAAETDKTITKVRTITKEAADAEHYYRSTKSFGRGLVIGLIFGIAISIAVAANHYEPIRDVVIKINNALLEARQQQN